MDTSSTLRIGILGAARIAPMALVRPAREVDGIEVAAIAARDPRRAEAFARKHSIPDVHENYDELISSPNIDAVYNPLPNSLHCEWSIKALETNKHVLCEKPIASNADEAARMAQAAEKTGLLLMEAFHWRYHPLAARMKEIVESGELGTVEHIEATQCVPLPLPGDIRYRFDLAGGAVMDTGCYSINMVRFLAGAEPEVVGARALLSSPKVDRAMFADLRFPDGRTGRIHCSLFSRTLLKIVLRVVGDRGEMRVFNAVAPQFFHRLSVRTEAGTRREKVPGEASYTGQLRAFVDSIRTSEPPPSDPADGVKNMRVIDSIYEAAGLPIRAH